MRIVFLGYGEIGATVLGRLAERHEVTMVVTHEPAYAGLREQHVVTLAEKLGLPFRFARRADEPQVLPVLREAAPEVLLSANWRTRLPESVLNIPTRYPVNVHDALLPAYAGFGSVNWSIRNGESRIGLTVHVMERELDTGPVLHTVEVPIGEDETAGSVYAALLREYPDAVLTALDRIAQDVRRAKRPVRAYRGIPGRVVKHAEGGVAVSCGPSWMQGSDGIILLEARWENEQPGPAERILPGPGIQLT
ncbi:formyltransferase family protein [Streptomyces roseifaciens]